MSRGVIYIYLPFEILEGFWMTRWTSLRAIRDVCSRLAHSWLRRNIKDPKPPFTAATCMSLPLSPPVDSCTTQFDMNNSTWAPVLQYFWVMPWR
jgi:hypothetical protein